MQLISLKVDGFRCIQKARIELKPGLNILHGPNDLGKSTLAMAIRAVLLLTHNQREHESFIPWSEDAAPSVELRFEMKEKGYYQVTKFFGDGNRGKSLLGWSKDGRDYAVTTKGREVDEELRKLLRWGVPAPGGKARTRGMPETFLTEVLMPNQSQVARVLELSLETDPDDSGKAHLTQVLQAMATDPVFKRVFAAATAKVDEAYTPTGQRKRGRGSPWAEARDRINELQRDVDRLKADVVKSQDAENKARLLSEQLAEKRLKIQDAADRLTALESRWAAKQKRSTVEEEERIARAALLEIERLFKAVAETEVEIGSLARKIADASQKLVRSKEQVEGAETSLKVAEEQKARLESEAGEQARTIERAKLETALAEAASTIAALENEKQRASEAKRETDALHIVEARAAELTGRIAGLAGEQDSAKRSMEDAKGAVEESKQLEAVARHLDAKRQYDGNELAIEKAKALREKVARLRDEAKALETRLATLTLPTKAQLQSLRTLKHKLDLAEAETALALSVQPERALAVSISTDDALEIDDRIESAKTIEARRSIRLVIAGVGEITAVAGRPEARKEADDLGRRWKLEGRTVLDAAGAADLDALAGMIEEAERLRIDADARSRESDSMEAALKEIVVRDRAELRHLMDERELPLRDLDRNTLLAKLERIGADRLDLEEASLRKKLDAAIAKAGQLELELTKLDAELKRDEEAISEQKQRLEPRLAALGASPQSVLERVQNEQRKLERGRNETKARLEALDREAKTAIVDASRAVETARSSVATAKEAASRAEAELGDLQKRNAAAQALLDERRRNAEAADRAKHEARIAELAARLSAMPVDPDLSESMIEQARSDFRREEQLADSIEADLNAARGALEHVGGSVVKEQEEDLEEALRLASRGQQDLDMEYEAWRLLVETLKEAEKEQAGHLGRALVEPIRQRFAELTEGRYPKLAIGPNLEAQKIVAEGGEREIGSLSVGTREQLATLIRICLAERLGTCLILDDQLTQSDPTRIGWVRELLYETANRLQIIVLTCRPEDYVRPGTGCTIVDLAKCVNRYGAKRVLPDGSTRSAPASNVESPRKET